MKLNTTYSLFFALLIFITNVSLAQDDSTNPELTDPISEELDGFSFQDSLSPEEKVRKQDPIKMFDMGVYSTQKAFKSRKVKRHSMWERIENDCALD